MVNVLLLNASFEPLAVVKLSRAIGLLMDGKVEVIEPVESDTVRLSDTPEKIGKMVRATFTGTGTKKILLIAHMDTVYPKGMAVGQPFKIEGDRVYGLGIADARGGLGIGLHLVKRITELHGGSLRAESAGKGQGATFTIVLPRPAAWLTTTHSAA